MSVFLPSALLSHQTHRHVDKGIGNKQMAIPMQHHAAVEMSSYLDSSDTWHNLLILLFEQYPFCR